MATGADGDAAGTGAGWGAGPVIAAWTSAMARGIMGAMVLVMLLTGVGLPGWLGITKSPPHSLMER
jgi:hypothetical protein